MQKQKILLLFVVVFLGGVICAASASAQVTGATLSGTVTDSSGAIVPNAQISIRDTATNVSRTVATDSAGFYSAPNLVPSNYEVTVTATGFSTYVQSGITLTVGAKQVLNITLQVGQVSQKVQVTGEAPAVELASSTVGNVVESNTVLELPLNGRDWTQLATLQPGANAVLTQQPTGANTLRGNRGFGNEISISGTRPQQNNYREDGISVVDGNGGSPGSVIGEALGVDAIAEFSVLTSNYSAEYGRTSGGVINAITRSGTNEFHGDAYWFARNAALDARSYFDPAQIPAFQRNQFGGSVGGPIQKDKTFFFVDYEGFRQSLGTTTIDNVPSPNLRNGIINNANGTTTVVTVNPRIATYMGLYHIPNAGLIGPLDNTGRYDFTLTTVGHDNYVIGRFDHKFSDKDSIFGTYNFDTSIETSPDASDNWLFANTSVYETLALEETHTFNDSLVNTVRVGYHRMNPLSGTGAGVINPLAGETSIGAFPGWYSPTATVSGLTAPTGLKGSPIFHEVWNSVQAYDDAFWTKGAHSIKFGVAFERMEPNDTVHLAPDGGYTFSSLQNFLTNIPTSFNGTNPTHVSEIGARQSLFGTYIQDDWRFRKNLTINLGLRYEMVTVPTTVNNELSNLRTFSSPTPFLGSPYFQNPTLHNFEPRIGFAWDPFGTGKTSIRGAGGIFDALPLNNEFYLAEARVAPYTIVESAQASCPAGTCIPLTQGDFPAGGPLKATTPSALEYGSVQFNAHRNYVAIWNLNVQRELTPSVTLQVGYVGSAGIHNLDREDDVNSVEATATPYGYLFPAPIGSGTKINPAAGEIIGEWWGGHSHYDAMDLTVTKRLSHSFQVQGSFTWQKSFDDGSAADIGDPFQNSITSIPFWCESCRVGLSDFDVTKTLIVNYVWSLPTPKNEGPIVEHLLGGWQLAGIITAETGLPFTPLINGNAPGLNSTDNWDFPDRILGGACGSAINPGNVLNYINLNCFTLPALSPSAPASLKAQCVPFSNTTIPNTCANLYGNGGRNSLIGPGVFSWDFSLYKNNYFPKISENLNAQFRLEMFNFLNHSNFLAPIDNSTLFNADGSAVGAAGAIDTISVPNREIQVALKVIF